MHIAFIGVFPVYPMFGINSSTPTFQVIDRSETEIEMQVDIKIYIMKFVKSPILGAVVYDFKGIEFEK